MKIEIKVVGMKCTKCVDKIEKGIGEIDGVILIDVDLAQSLVRVEFESPASESMIKEAILDVGFELA